MSHKRAIEIVEEIYEELFREATPPLNYRELLEAPEGVKRAFDYNDHYLLQERYEEIVQKHLNKSRLPEHWKKCIQFTVYLGHGPLSANKETI